MLGPNPQEKKKHGQYSVIEEIHKTILVIGPIQKWIDTEQKWIDTEI